MRLTDKAREIFLLSKEPGLLLSLIYYCRRYKLSFKSNLYASQLGIKKFYVDGEEFIPNLSALKIGENFYAGRGLWLEAVKSFGGVLFDPKIEIGENFVCSCYVHIGAIGNIRIGANVIVGSKVLITDHDHGDYSGTKQSHPNSHPYARRLHSRGDVDIGDNVLIGDGSVVLSGVTIGSGSVIGANSVVKHSIPANSIAAGNPAYVVKTFSFESEKWISALTNIY